MVQHSSLTKGSFSNQQNSSSAVASHDVSMDPPPQDEPGIELFTLKEMQAFVEQEVERILDARESRNKGPNINAIDEEASPADPEELVQLVDDKPPQEHKAEERDMLRKQSNNRKVLQGTTKSMKDGTDRTATYSTSNSDELPQDRDELVALMDSVIEKREMHTPFGESIYTILYLSKVKSQGFVYSILVWALQMAMISLTLADQIDRDSVTNQLQIPPMVDKTVTTVQAFSLFILLAYVSDLMEAILKLQEGYFPEVHEKYPGATFSTWLFSCFAQLLAGLLLVTASLILTMASETVINVVLNLTALLFITELDDLAFALAKMGFITNKLQKEALAVRDVQIPKRKTRNRSRRVLYLITLMGLFIGYGILKHKQLAGDYLPTNIYVQFGDGFNPKIPYYSGILTSSGNGWTATYREYRDLASEKLVLLGYCHAENAWTFSVINDPFSDSNPCDYFAKSDKTTSYDVTSIPDSEWQVVDSNDRLQPFDSFSLVSRDCTRKTCKGKCGADGLCQCPHDQFGMDCEFSDVCPGLVVDQRFGSFPALRIGDTAWISAMGGFESLLSDEFQLLQTAGTNTYAKVYNMPVYYSNQTYPANILFFGGRRWILTSEWDLFNLTEAMLQSPDTHFFPEKTIDALENKFHGHHQASYTPLLFSDPVDFETPDFLPTPIGLGWWTVKEENETLRHYVPDAALETVFVCIQGEESCVGRPEDFCGNFGYCNDETGTCECANDDVLHGDRCDVVKPCYESQWGCAADGDCDESTGFCRCNWPHYGPFCYDTCKCYEQCGSCKNGGICNATTGACDCPNDPGISGEACEKIAECRKFGCANGGICGHAGTCFCHPPFHGAHCDLVDRHQEEFFCSTDGVNCVNGNCNNKTGICACTDESSYGTLCQHKYNCADLTIYFGEVLQVPCLNSGICNEITGICECTDPYFGPDCSQVPPCLSDDDCGGNNWLNTCDVDTGFCNCFDGPAAGKRCEKQSWCSDDDDCFNRGTCNDFSATCECKLGNGGRLCELLIFGMYPPLRDEKHAELENDIERCGFEDPECVECNVADPPPDYCGCGTGIARKNCWKHCYFGDPPPGWCGCGTEDAHCWCDNSCD